MSARSSSSGSPTPSTSTAVSPAIPPLTPSIMAPAPPEDNDLNRTTNGNAQGGPQTNDRAGCWTCRIRRKRCDLERLEGNSCRTCKRLTIECLGWGARRPEWMRNKQAVDDYKAQIKAQLTRKGLIRGQPRSTMLQAQAGGAAGTSSTTTSTRPRRNQARNNSANGASRSPNMRGESDSRNGFNHDNMLSLPSSSRFPAESYSDDMNSLNLNVSYFASSPLQTASNLPFSVTSPESDFSSLSLSGVSPTSSSHSGSLLTPSIGTGTVFGGGLGMGGSEFDTFGSGGDMQQTEVPLLSGQNAIQEQHVMYYFQNIWRVHFLLSNNTVMNTTYELIVNDPRGALTNAVCALASLHSTRMRVAQGLEAPDPNPEHSTAKYFYDESYFQLVNAKQLRGSYTETDVLAALHLVCFSQLSGGTTDWQPVLQIALDWIQQLGLPSDDNPGITLGMMNVAGQLSIKCTMIFDIISSLTMMRPPKYHNLYQRLLTWTDTNLLLQPGGMQMEVLTCCPDEAWLAIAEISTLSYWKSSEERKGTLSFRELVRRGDVIEQRLRQQIANAQFQTSDPLQQPGAYLANVEIFPSEDVRRLVASIFRETALLYLHTVVNNPSPGVPEINSQVDALVGLIRQLAPSDIDRILVLPICLAGSMTDDSMHREFLKGRLKGQDETIGNIMKTRFLMEGVWQRRDVGTPGDWRDMMRDRGINLLLM